MNALYLVEFVLGILFVYFMFTQAIIPLWRNTPLFPALERESKLKHKLKQERQGIVEAVLEDAIEKTHKKAEKIRERK